MAIFGCESRFKTRKKNIIFIKKNVMDKIRIGLKNFGVFKGIKHHLFARDVC